MATIIHFRGAYGVDYAFSYGAVGPIPHLLKPLAFHDALQATQFLRTLNVGENGLQELLRRDKSGVYNLWAINKHNVIGALAQRLAANRLRVYLKILVDALSTSTRYQANTLNGVPLMFLELRDDYSDLISNLVYENYVNSIRFNDVQQVREFVDELDISSDLVGQMLGGAKAADRGVEKKFFVSRLFQREIIVVPCPVVPKFSRQIVEEVEEVEEPRAIPVAPRKPFTPKPVEEVIDEAGIAQAVTLKVAAKNGTPFCEECEKAKRAAA